MSCTLDRSMLLLSLVVFVTVADAGAVHVGVTGAIHVGLTMSMAMAMAIVYRTRPFCDINVK